MIDCGWTDVRLRDLVTLNDSVLRDSTDPSVEFDYVEISDVQANRGIIGSSRTAFGEAPSRARRIVAPGDVLVSTVRTYLRAVASVDRPLVASTGFAALRARDCADSRFLHYVCVSKHFTDWTIAHSVGVSYPAINAADLVRYKLRVPPVAGQRVIADFLDRETVKIDALIDKHEQLIGTLQEDRIATITQAVTKGLRNEPCEVSKTPYLDSHPKSWVPTKLKYHASVQTGITLGKSAEVDRSVTLPYLRVANVQAGSVNLAEVKELAVDRSDLSSYLLRAGDVLMTEGGDIDKLGRGCVWNGEIDPCIHQNHIFAVRCGESLTNKFLVYLLETDHARDYFMLTAKKTTNLASTNSTTLKALPIALPTAQEQAKIVEFLDGRADRLNQLTSAAAVMIERLREYRSALITEAVTGKIDAREMV